MSPARILALALLALTVPRVARACSCLPPPPPSAAAEQASAVFLGRSFEAEPSGHELVYRFEVLTVFKGELASKLALRTQENSAACGRRFEPGKTYLVYAHQQPGGSLSDNLCSRTRLADTASEDLAVLGAGQPPRSEGGKPSEAAAGDAEPPRIGSPPATSPGGEEQALAPSARGCALAPLAPQSNPLALGLLAILLLGPLRSRPSTRS